LPGIAMRLNAAGKIFQFIGGFPLWPKQMSNKHQEGNKTCGKNYLNNHRQI